jgi:hypothetical protein
MAGTPDLPEGRKDSARDAAMLAKRRRARSIAIALALVALVFLFYLVTIIKLGPGVMGRPL